MSKDAVRLKVGDRVSKLEDEVKGRVTRVFPDGCVIVAWSDPKRFVRIFPQDELKLIEVSP